MFRTALLRGVSACALTLAFASASLAQEELPPIDVAARPPTERPSLAAPLSEEILDHEDIAREKPAAADTVQLLRDTPGVSFYEGGGVSRLPALHGLADDRINILIGGVSVHLRLRQSHESAAVVHRPE